MDCNLQGLPANLAKLPDKGVMLLSLHLLHCIVLTCWVVNAVTPVTGLASYLG